MPLTSLNFYTLKQVGLARSRYDLESCTITCPPACYKGLQTFLNLSSEPVEKFSISQNNKNMKLFF